MIREGNMVYHYIPLDQFVIAVAVVNEWSTDPLTGDWRAYISAVFGMRHDDEWRAVAERGTGLSEEVAEVLFPFIPERYPDFKYRR